MWRRCQATTEYYNMVLGDLDAAGWYDRQRTELIGLVTQSIEAVLYSGDERYFKGVPILHGVLIWRFAPVLGNILFNKTIKTGNATKRIAPKKIGMPNEKACWYDTSTHSVSSETIQRYYNNDLGGSGQGNGASGPDWHCTNEWAIPIYASKVRGSHICAPDDHT